jgi:hypothetical protein
MTNKTVAPSQNRVKVKVLGFSRSPKPAVLVTVRIELSTESGDSITIDDARVLRNRHGQLWLAMPAYAIPTNGGRSYEYQPSIILSTSLRRAVEDAVLPAFEQWEREAVKP